MSSLALKEEGNEKFKKGQYEDALSCYTQALDLSDIKDSEKANLYKNRAMCYLKMDSFEEAAKDATQALDLGPNDPKALYRRCLAYEGLGKIEEAYKDAAMLIKVDPKNTSVKPVLARLTPIIREKAKHQSSTSASVTQMFNLLFDTAIDKEKRIQAANNLTVLAREEGACKIILEQGGVSKFKELLFSKEDMSILQAGVRILGTLTQNSKQRSQLVHEGIGVVRLGQLMAMPNSELSTSVASLLQNMIVSITDITKHKDAMEAFQEQRRKGDPVRRPKFEMDDYQQKFVDEVFTGLLKMLQHIKVSACGRDAAMELLIKNVTRKTGVHWTKQFLDTEGIEALLVIAGAIKQHDTLPITDQSKMHASLLLNDIWEDLLGEKESDKFKEKVSNHFKELFSNDEWESKVEAVKAISMLLQGPHEVGSMILGFEGVTQIMLGLASSDRILHQQLAVEAIISSASKKVRCSALLQEAVPVLKKLYHDGSDDHIKVRALVGLCKLGSYGGSDASDKPMAEGSTVTLAKACRKFLSNPEGDLDMKQWGTEGLAYLTLDADVKEQVVHDPKALSAVIEAAMHPNKNFMYTTATLFVNLTNSTDKQQLVPEMVELAKYAKQHIPEEHPKDKEEYVKERVTKLVAAGMISALIALSKTQSKNTREQVCRVLLTVATEECYRGQIVQVGGVKSLLNMYLENNTDLGKQVAAQTLAKIAITQDPKITFSGQRMYEVVRPLISLLHVERSGLQNFEALLALTNLSSISDSVRKRIVSERGIPNIEQYMYEDHEMLQRAATECMCNMVMNEEVAKMFEGDNDRVKLFTLFCGDEDEKVIRAASGALAILSTSEVVCRKILEVNKWSELLLSVAVSESLDIQHRGCHLIRNMVWSHKEVAEKVLEGQMLEVMMALSIIQDPEKQKVKECAEAVLQQAEEYGIIKKKDDSS